MLIARQLPPPPESRLAGTYAGATLADAFAISLPADGTEDINRLAHSALCNPAPWFRALLKVRDGLVTPFGLKTSQQLRQKMMAGGDSIDFFPVLDRFDQEIILGEDDRHLDFRVSVLIRTASPDRSREIVLTTVVHCHNRLGRAYLKLILPFHTLVARSNLERAARRGWPVAETL